MELTYYPRTPRLVNHFTLGSDPEFTFETTAGTYQHAEELGLTTMTAFGCDMAGRQAELRAHPSKFALEVVASMVDAMRWMAFVYGPIVLPLKWEALAFNGKDGCGGHIHFGTKRGNRQQVIKILDHNTQGLVEMDVLNKHQFNKRRTQTRYGEYSDIRPQTHGFEYRTLPTTLESPWLCYFVMVLNKLSVHEGTWFTSPSSLDHQTTAIELLKKYADRDDDAAIALKAVYTLGFPKMLGKDIKPNWGLPFFNHLIEPLNMERTFFPSVMAPEDRTCHELFEYLTNGTVLPNRKPEATWAPFTIPQDFMKIAVQAHTLGHLPDIGMNLLSRKYQIDVQVGAIGGVEIQAPFPLPTVRIRERLKEVIPVIGFTIKPQNKIRICIDHEINRSLNQCKALHDVLADSSLFPAAKAKDIYKIEWHNWDSTATESRKTIGRVVARVKWKASPSTVPEVKKKAVNVGQLDPNWNQVVAGDRPAAFRVQIPAPRARVRRVVRRPEEEFPE